MVTDNLRLNMPWVWLFNAWLFRQLVPRQLVLITSNAHLTCILLTTYQGFLTLHLV